MKVRLKIPKNFHFETKLKIRVSDINYGGHLGNDAVLSLAHESRIQFFKSLDMTERDFFGASLIMADSIVIYKSQGFLGDEINVQIAITESRSHGFKLVYLFKKTEDNVDLAHIQTSMVFYDYNKKKISRLPIPFKLFLNRIKI